MSTKEQRPNSYVNDHKRKRVALTRVGIFLLVIGVPLFLLGIGLFGSSMLTSSSEFFSDPQGVMDRNKQRVVIGMAMFLFGGVCSTIGIALVFFAHKGKVARYAAEELTPVAQDVARDLTKAIKEGLVAKTPKKVAHSCGTVNDAEDRFCKGCCESLAGHVCSSCGKKNDPDARFCDDCGQPLK